MWCIKNPKKPTVARVEKQVEIWKRIFKKLFSSQFTHRRQAAESCHVEKSVIKDKKRLLLWEEKVNNGLIHDFLLPVRNYGGILLIGPVITGNLVDIWSALT